jgi:NADPH:quinone reductase-like Zn-dependent oxidoreductase
MKAVYIEQNGGIDALRYGDRPVPEPGPGEVLQRLRPRA